MINFLLKLRIYMSTYCINFPFKTRVKQLWFMGSKADCNNHIRIWCLRYVFPSTLVCRPSDCDFICDIELCFTLLSLSFCVIIFGCMNAFSLCPVILHSGWGIFQTFGQQTRVAVRKTPGLRASTFL